MKKIKKSTLWLLFIVFALLFAGSIIIVTFNLDVLKIKPLQKTTSFSAPAMAKYERDGNLYVIDNGSFRLVCMTIDGNILYTINIDRMKEYTRIVDAAIDDYGNLYVYAIEAEYDALLTKRDIIRKYDNHGNFLKDIVSINYDNSDPISVRTNPRLFYQFGSFRYDNGMLTFSQTKKDSVVLYMYDTFRDQLQQSELTGVHDFSVAQLVIKDMNNFAYVLRDGDIFEVKNGGGNIKSGATLRASFDWNLDEGGIIPWFIFYDDPDYGSDDNLIFFDMGSNELFRLTNSGIWRVIPEVFFENLIEQGEVPSLKGFGFHKNIFAGVFGDTVWLYDGENFKTYDNELKLPLGEILRIAIVQVSIALGVLAFFFALYILFVGILDRYVSLFIKLTVVIIPLLIIAFIIVFSLTFNIMAEQLNNALFNEMIAIAVLSSKMIDGDDIEKINSIKDFHSVEYKRLSRQVKEIVGYNADPWNKAFYAAIYKGEKFEYVVAISCEEYNIFRPDETLDDEDFETVMNGKPIAAIFEMYNGNWGFAIVPVYNNKGDITGIFELGLDMTGFEIGNAKLQRYVAFLVAAICLVILAALCILISIIVKRLSAVGRVVHNIARGDRSARVSYMAKDELGEVSSGLNNMAEELQDQFDRITRLNESTIRFVPVQFMEHLGVSDITKMKLGDNVQRDISVLFFDIRYFSVNSEMMTAKENFDFINKILGLAGPIIRKHNGFVDKYIGDAAMALFPKGIDAVKAGIELYQTMIIDKTTKVKIGVDGIKIGVGVHTGSVMMGIVGENERLSSTVISANVNLASRVESLTKQTGSGMLITRGTLNHLVGHESEFEYRFIGMVQAAGVNEVMGLFDMLDALSPKERKIRLATKDVFESGVRKFHMKDYAAAVHRFQKVVAADPTDICAAHHLEEAHKHLQSPELPSVFIFDRK